MINTHMASKEDLKAVTTRLDSIDGRLDGIENLLLTEQKREIEDLKKRMKKLEDALPAGRPQKPGLCALQS